MWCMLFQKRNNSSDHPSKKINMKKIIVCVFLLSGALHTWAQKEVPTKVIYFMAGIKDHGPASRHETEKDLLVLQHCIDSISNVKGVKIVTRFIYNRTALDISDMKDASAIIIESSAEASNPVRTHPLFPPSGDNKRSYDPSVVKYLNQ